MPAQKKKAWMLACSFVFIRASKGRQATLYEDGGSERTRMSRSSRAAAEKEALEDEAAIKINGVC